jgi:hypothetical protein
MAKQRKVEKRQSRMAVSGLYESVGLGLRIWPNCCVCFLSFNEYDLYAKPLQDLSIRTEILVSPKLIAT